MLWECFLCRPDKNFVGPICRPTSCRSMWTAHNNNLRLSKQPRLTPFWFSPQPHFALGFSSVLWHCWLGDRKDIRPVKSCVLLCWWWRFDWSFACLIAPVATTTCITLSSNVVRSGDILVPANPGQSGKWPLKRRDFQFQFLFLSAFVAFLTEMNYIPKHSWDHADSEYESVGVTKK